MENEFLPFHRPALDDDEEREIIEVLRSGWLTTGSRAKKFEKDFAEYIGVKHAIALSSCTAALHLSLICLGIGEGDEVITTPMTFAATANVICLLGAKPVFVDIDPGTLNINPDLIENSITGKTRAIIPVHYGGHPCEMDKIRRIAEKYNIFIIEDAAHAIESEYKNEKCGSMGETGCFSFYANKNITTGEGGMLTTGNDDLAARVRVLSLHGLSRDAWKRYSSSGKALYQVIEAGFKYNMSDLQAALGIHQLRKIENFLHRRKEIVKMYKREFELINEIEFLRPKPYVKSAFHIFPVILKKENLINNWQNIFDSYKNEGIGVSHHFYSLHLQPYYRDQFGYKPEDFPVADRISKSLITLPLYPLMKDGDVKRVIETTKSILNRFL